MYECVRKNSTAVKNFVSHSRLIKLGQTSCRHGSRDIFALVTLQLLHALQLENSENNENRFLIFNIRHYK